MSRDPIQEAGSISLYSFALNEPVASIDALGRMASRMQCPPEEEKPFPEEGCIPGDTRTMLHPTEVHGGEYTGRGHASDTVIGMDPIKIRVRCYCERKNYEIHVVKEHQKCVAGTIWERRGTRECCILVERDATWWEKTGSDVEITEIPLGHTLEGETICGTTQCVVDYAVECVGWICPNLAN